MFTGKLSLTLNDHMLFTGFGNAWFKATEIHLDTCCHFKVLGKMIGRYNSGIYYNEFCIYYSTTTLEVQTDYTY